MFRIKYLYCLHNYALHNFMYWRFYLVKRLRNKIIIKNLAIGNSRNPTISHEKKTSVDH